MRTEIIIKHLGYVLFLNGIFMFISFGISLYLKETSAIPLLFSALICCIFGVFPQVFVERTDSISFMEGLAIVVLGWIMTCLAGMMPYLMWGGEFSLINSWFESVSGFTTTGSTILNDIEAVPKGLLFWRSSTHWIGGIGVIIFVLLILPKSTASRISLYHSEISDLSKMGFRSRPRGIIQILAMVYLVLTLAETLILYLLGMSLFDAVNHSFATIATGGFSTRNLSIAHYDNFWIELTIIIFMVLSGIHFGILYATVLMKSQNIFTSPLVKAFVGVLLLGILLVSLKLSVSGHYSPLQALRHAAFQVVSLGTTTGFATRDTALWPVFTQIILIYFTIQCALTGSTSGGLKFDRVYIFMKSISKQIKIMKHPQGVFVTRLGPYCIDEKLEQQTLVFIIAYIFTFFLTTFFLTAMDIDSMTAFSASIATIGNVGPGLGEVGSMGNYAQLPALAKFMLTLNMFFGRLEIFNILALIMIRR